MGCPWTNWRVPLASGHCHHRWNTAYLCVGALWPTPAWVWRDVRSAVFSLYLITIASVIQHLGPWACVLCAYCQPNHPVWCTVTVGNRCCCIYHAYKSSTPGHSGSRVLTPDMKGRQRYHLSNLTGKRNRDPCSPRRAVCRRSVHKMFPVATSSMLSAQPRTAVLVHCCAVTAHLRMPCCGCRPSSHWPKHSPPCCVVARHRYCNCGELPVELVADCLPTVAAFYATPPVSTPLSDCSTPPIPSTAAAD